VNQIESWNSLKTEIIYRRKWGSIDAGKLALGAGEGQTKFDIRYFCMQRKEEKKERTEKKRKIVLKQTILVVVN
jgi:hypothetical protein